MTTIEQIKTALQTHIAEAEAVPAKKWRVRKSAHGTFICKDDDHSVGIPTDVCRLWNSSALEANALFIAHARTMSPAACKCLLLAIEGLGKVAYIKEDAGQPDHSFVGRTAASTLKSIRQEWINLTTK
jgi:hypothetical protein